MDITVRASTHIWNVNFFDVSQLIKKNPQTCNLKERSNMNADLFDPPQLLPFECWAELYLMAATMVWGVVPSPQNLLLTTDTLSIQNVRVWIQAACQGNMKCEEEIQWACQI